MWGGGERFTWFSLLLVNSVSFCAALNLLCADIYEPHCEKNGLRGFQQGQTETRLYNHKR